MSETKEDPFAMTSLVDTWIKSMSDVIGNMADQSSSPKAKASTDAALKNWQTMTCAMARPASISALLNGSDAMPEMLLSLAQSYLVGFGEMQKKTIERFGRVSTSVNASDLENIDENLFRIWTDIYQKEFKQFFQIPQLGLLRTYQEKANQVIDKYNFYQSTLAEFLTLLALPFNRTMQMMQEQLGEMAENGTLPEDTKIYYNMWVKVLEGHYMTLYQTPAYVETMARTINALADYSAARDVAFEDMLSLLPVARKSEMDDMAQEFYELKKRLRKLEKEHNKSSGNGS